MTRAVVFGYHNVGVRCLKVLLARGIDVALVVTHQDNPSETIWFESVAALCQEHGIPFVTPDDPKSPELFAQVKATQPDFRSAKVGSPTRPLETSFRSPRVP